MRVSAATVTALACGVLSIAGCDSAPGPASMDGRPPVVSELTYTPESVVRSLVPAEQVVGEHIRIPLTFSVRVADEDRDVEQIGYVVRLPVADTAVVARGTLAIPSAGRYERTTELLLPRGTTGPYTLTVFAIDAAGHLSNQVRGLIEYTAEAAPPVLEAVEAPDVVVRPSAGQPARVLEIVAVVSDPDGLSNVSSVVFWNVTNPAQTIELFDDGQFTGSGDQEAGDGRYTRRIQITSDNQPGTNTFHFQATDRAGLKSNVVEKQIRVE